MLWWFTSIVLILILAYFRTPVHVWVTLVLLWILSSSSTGWLSMPVTLLSILLLAIIAAPLFLPDLRRSLISDKLLALFRQLLPGMSETEKIALEAGTVWWDKELFSGSPNWKRLQATPPSHLNQEEQAFIDGPVEELCALIDDWRITNEDEDLSPEVWSYLKENKFFGMIIPKVYGGLEFTAYGHSSVITKISSRSITAAVTTMVPNSLGPAELLLHYGTESQKDHYLPRLACGDEIPCFALTEPEAGSDAGAMSAHGIICHSNYMGKKNVLGIRLNWNKRYITLGPVATVLGLAFKLYDPDQLLSDNKTLGITLALIPTDTAGITIGARHNPLNTPFQNGPNSGKDVFIPMDWVIGEENGIGQGWRMLMESLAVGRSISLPALSTGAGKLISATTGAYARIRHQFHMPIGHFEGVEEALSSIAGYTYIMEATRRLTCAAVDIGEKPSVLSAIAKYNLTEMMRKTINHAMDVQGGSGICLGPRNLVGNAYQAIPVGITVEGANILTRTMIVFGQGAIRCHPYLLKEMQAAQNKNPYQSSKKFDEALFSHIGWSLSNIAKSLLSAVSDARFISTPDSYAKRYYQQFSRMSACFAVAADTSALLLGGSLKRRESLSGRLADALSHLYLGSAVLKHFLDNGEKKSDQILVDWACQYCLYQIQYALIQLYQNMPLKSAGWVMRLITFPLGRRYKLPSDKLNHKIARLLLQPSEARDHLIAGIFISKDPNEQTAKLEDTLRKLVDTAEIDKRLHKAIRGTLDPLATDEDKINAGIEQEIITTSEAEQLLSAWVARTECIQVDAFETAEKER